ncbi:STAS domain-containing protein [Streptomyces sp. NPDC091268]|uniref:STAS domain-containing protein n=1 Tax=Streptomyces sp. NPDC091268 TaxID=3365979 RepID=UPI00380C0562
MEQQVRVQPDEAGVRVIVCAGEFDQDTLEPFREACGQAAADPEVRRVVLDVSQVGFADSSMLNQMLILLRTGRLVLAGPLPPQLGRLLDLTEARSLFTVADSVEAASSL